MPPLLCSVSQGQRDRAPANSGLSLLTASAKAQGQGAPDVGNCKSGALLQEVLLMILWGKAHAGLGGRGVDLEGQPLVCWGEDSQGLSSGKDIPRSLAGPQPQK